MLLGGEHRVEPRGLLLGEEARAGVEGAADPVERVAGVTAVPECVLLDALPGPVERVAGQADDVERVHHRDRVGELFGRGGLEPGEPVHRDHLDPARPLRRPGGEPLLEHLLRAALDHVQQPGRAGARADAGPVPSRTGVRSMITVTYFSPNRV